MGPGPFRKSLGQVRCSPGGPDLGCVKVQAAPEKTEKAASKKAAEAAPSKAEEIRAKNFVPNKSNILHKFEAFF